MGDVVHKPNKLSLLQVTFRTEEAKGNKLQHEGALCAPVALINHCLAFGALCRNQE